jgi:hypothetical protein
MMLNELVRRVLVDASGKPLCDSCLALACGTTQTKMRQITKALIGQDTFQPGSTCAGCRRTGPTIVYRSKCAQCSQPPDAGVPSLLMGGDLFHVHCLRRLITDDTIPPSRALNRRSRDLIEQSRCRIRQGHGWPLLDRMPMTSGVVEAHPSLSPSREPLASEGPSATDEATEQFVRELRESPTDLAKLVKRIHQRGCRVVPIAAKAIARWNKDDPDSWERVREWLARRGVRIMVDAS